MTILVQHAHSAQHAPRHAASQVTAPLHGGGVGARSAAATAAKHSIRKRIVTIIAAVLASCLVGAGAWAAWYMNAVNSAMSLNSEDSANLNAVLTDTAGNDPFYILVLGSDSREGTNTSTTAAEMGDQQRSDVMMVVRVDPANKVVTMVSIPRDTKWESPQGTTKVNEALNMGGPALAVQAAQDITGVKISHYVQVDFSDFQDIVDSVGGIDVNVPIQLSYADALTGETVTIEPGQQTLNGTQAQIFVRARHEYGDNQEAHRQSNVRTAVLAIYNKIKKQPLNSIPGTALQIADSITTDFTANELVSLAMNFTGDSQVTIYSGTGPTRGEFNDNGAWYCYQKPEVWAQLMAVVDAGGDPSTVDVDADATPATTASSAVTATDTVSTGSAPQVSVDGGDSSTASQYTDESSEANSVLADTVADAGSSSEDASDVGASSEANLAGQTGDASSGGAVNGGTGTSNSETGTGSGSNTGSGTSTGTGSGTSSGSDTGTGSGTGIGSGTGTGTSAGTDNGSTTTTGSTAA